MRYASIMIFKNEIEENGINYGYPLCEVQIKEVFDETPVLYKEDGSVLPESEFYKINLYPIEYIYHKQYDWQRYERIMAEENVAWFLDSTANIVYQPCELIEYDFEQAKNIVKDKITEIRFEHESSNIIYNGINISTDRESQSMLTSTYVLMLQDNNRVIRWKCGQEWIDLDFATINSLIQVISTYVEDCFNNEETLYNEVINIADNDWASLININLNSGWPNKVINI